MARRSGGWVQRIGLGVIVGLIVLAFVLVFNQPTAAPGPQTVGMVGGEPIPRELFEVVRAQLESRRGEMLPDDATDELVAALVDRPALELLLRTHVLAYEARSLGLRVSDDELREQICSIPGLTPCNADTVTRVVQSQGYPDVRTYTDQLRRDLLVMKLQRLLLTPVRISEAAVRERLWRDRLSLRLRYAVARVDAFREAASVDESEAAALADSDPDRVREEYQRRIDEFQQPEQVRARHILFTGDDALQRATDARARLDAGEDFVLLAAELSNDPATRERGGELGWLPRGRMLPQFDEAAFLADERSAVGPVTTERGVHLIRVEERRAAVERSFDEMKTLLAWDLLRDERAAELAGLAAERMAALLAEGKGFDAAAEEAGLTLDETVQFRPADPLVPGIGRIPGLAETAMELTLDEPVSRRVFGSVDVFYLISLADRREPDPQALTDDIELIREQMLAAERNRMIDALYRARAQELEQAGELQTFLPLS